MDCTIYVAKTKALVSITTQLICSSVFVYAKIWFSHDAAQIKIFSDNEKIIFRISP